MMLPLLHHGMVMVGLPFTEAGITRAAGGGTPYGASQYSSWSGDRALDEDEAGLCRALGRRVASIALKLQT